MAESPRASDTSVKDGDSAVPSQTIDEKPKSSKPLREDGSEYPEGVAFALLCLALCLSVFLMALDTTIIATAIPKITDEFQSLTDVGWYGSAYLITTGAIQLLFGKFYSFFSIKWVFLTAIAIFEVGSVVCGAAPNSTALILGRAVAGLGGSGIFSGAMIILAHSVPLERRPLWSGLITSMYGIASVGGPLLGGAFTDHVSWRWCFYINLPIGGVAVAVILFFFKDPPQKSTFLADHKGFYARVMQFDPLGTVFFIPSIVTVLIGLQWGGTKYPWSDGRIIALFVVSGITLIAFIAVQYWAGDSATVPPRLIRQRSMWSSAIFSFFLNASFIVGLYYLPLWFQAVKGASAVDSGLMNLGVLGSCIVFTMVGGAGVTMLGYYAPFMIAATVLSAVGFGLLSTFTPETDRAMWIGYQVIAGAGLGVGLMQPLMAVQNVLDMKDVPSGTAVMVFMQTIGAALWVSICQTIFTTELVENVQEFVPGLNPMVLLVSGATNIRNVISEEMLPGVVLAYNNALTKTFLVSAVLSAATIIGSAAIEWKSMKGKKMEMTAA